MFKFIHAADIHLDSPLVGLQAYQDAPVERMKNATRSAFINLVDLAIKEAVHFVLLVGDLYDVDWKDYGTGLFFSGQLARLKTEGIRVYIVQGNHDAESQITKALRLPDNVHMFATRKPESVRLDDLNVVIVGQGFQNRFVSENLCAGYPQAQPGNFTIGMLHTSVDGREGHAPYAPCTLSEITAKGYDYFALGHVHKREVLNQDPWVVFPGNIQGRHVRETGAKGCTLVEVDDGKIQSVVHHAIDVMRWARCEIDASGIESPEAILVLVEEYLKKEAIGSEGRPLAARIILQGSCVVHDALVKSEERWKNEIRNLAVQFSEVDIWVEKIKLETSSLVRSLDSEVGDDFQVGGQDTILKNIGGLKVDLDLVQNLQSEFADLYRKLPNALREGLEGIRLDEAEQLQDVIAHAQKHLISLLSIDGNPK